MPKGEITMDKDQYLQMIDRQLEESLDEMYDAEKKYNEAKAKYDAINIMRESYIKWVVEK
jgi:sulfur relay (sulfurtransferase) DsrC/TusE family protein